MHVKILCKEKLPTRHFDCSVSGMEKSHTFDCLQSKVNVSKIHKKILPIGYFYKYRSIIFKITKD